MARKTTAALVFLLLMNGSIGIMEASGLNDDLGVSPNLGVSDNASDTIDQSKQDFQASGGGSDTLFAIFVNVGGVAGDIFQFLFAAPIMFNNLGIPNWFIDPVFAPWYLISFLDILYIVSGRDI